MNENGTEFEEHEMMLFPQDPSQGSCRMELSIKIYNPDGRGFHIEVPHIQVTPDWPATLSLGEHVWDDEDQRRQEFIGFKLPASAMLPDGIVSTFKLTLIDPEEG